MPSALVLAATAIVVIYSFFRALVYLRHDSREPKPIVGAIPYISPLFGMLIGQDKFYKRMRYSPKFISPPQAFNAGMS